MRTRKRMRMDLLVFSKHSTTVRCAAVCTTACCLSSAHRKGSEDKLHAPTEIYVSEFAVSLYLPTLSIVCKTE
jgi:hypothetical protein